MEANEAKQKLILLRAKGVSFDRCAKELHKAKQTLVNWARELEDEIANARSFELDALADEFLLTKQKRLETLGKTLKKMQDELATRDFSDVPTDKLLDLHAKYFLLADAEYIEPKFKSEEEIVDAREEKETLDCLVTGRRPLRKLKSS